MGGRVEGGWEGWYRGNGREGIGWMGGMV